MIHLAYVSMELAPFDEGGPATVAHCLLKELMKAKNVGITLIVGNSATEKSILCTFGDRFENIIRIPLGRSIRDYTNVIIRKMKEVWEAFYYVDVVHVNNLYTIRNFYLPFFASLRRKPSILTHHSVRSSPEIQGIFEGEKAYAIKNSVLRTIYDLHKPLWSRIVVNSQFVKTIVLKDGFKQKIHLIPNGIDFDEIQKAPRVSLEGDIKLLFVGKIKKVKGLDLLLEALSLLKTPVKKKIKLYIAGSGPREEEYKSLAISLKVDKYIQFLGHLPLHKCYSLYKSCDILVLPSRLEGFPMTLLEALGSGIPIIATNVGGSPEIVKDNRNGLLVKLDTVEIAHKIQFLIDHPEFREQISRNNLMDAKEYSWQKIAGRYLALYESLI